MRRTSTLAHPAVEIVLEDAGENWGAYALGVPGVVATGPTEDACRISMESALAAHFRFVAREDAAELDRRADEARRELGACT